MMMMMMMMMMNLSLGEEAEDGAQLEDILDKKRFLREFTSLKMPLNMMMTIMRLRCLLTV